MIRVALVDDHPFMREGVSKLVAQQHDMRVVRELANGRAALRAVEECDFDVMVLDLSMPQVNGIEVLRRASELEPTLRVVVLSMYPAAQHAAQLQALGAAAFVSKSDPPEELIRAIRAAASGERYEREVSVEPSATQPRHRTLSGREHQVFTLIAQGQTVTEIAAKLDLSQSTVSNHLRAVREKLGVRTLAEIVRYAIEAGLIGPIVPH